MTLEVKNIHFLFKPRKWFFKEHKTSWMVAMHFNGILWRMPKIYYYPFWMLRLHARFGTYLYQPLMDIFGGLE